MADIKKIKIGSTTYNISPSWNNITDKPTTFAPSSHTHNSLAVVASIDGEDTATYPWRRIMSIPSTTSSWVDVIGTYYLSSNYYGGIYYLFRVEFRSNNSANGDSGNFSMRIIATNSSRTDLKMAYYSKAINGITTNYADIFVKVKSYPRMTLTRLCASDTGTIIYYNSKEGSGASSRTEAYIDINGSGTGYASYELHSLSEYTSLAFGTLTAKVSEAVTANHALTAGYLLGFSDRTSSQDWGNRTGTFITGMQDSTGGSIAWRRDNPNPGQMSMIIDGTVYVNEGNSQVWHEGNFTPSNYLALSGGTMTGSIKLKETNNILLRPSASDYTSGIGYDTRGDECIALWAKSAATRLRWHAGVDMSTSTYGMMMDRTPDFEISKASGTATGYIGGNTIIHTGNIGSQNVNYANSAGAVAWGNVTGKPSSFTPTSHTHTKSEVGLGNVDNTADANKSVNYANSAGSIAWNNVTGKPKIVSYDGDFYGYGKKGSWKMHQSTASGNLIQIVYGTETINNNKFIYKEITFSKSMPSSNYAVVLTATITDNTASSREVFLSICNGSKTDSGFRCSGHMGNSAFKIMDLHYIAIYVG